MSNDEGVYVWDNKTDNDKIMDILSRNPWWMRWGEIKPGPSFITIDMVRLLILLHKLGVRPTIV